MMYRIEPLAIIFLLIQSLNICIAQDGLHGEELASIEVRNNELANLEETIALADIATSKCQRETGWHFPVSLYNQTNKAQLYCHYKKNGRMQKKFHAYLDGLQEVLNETIEGIDGYWAGNTANIWVDPVPAAPVCAQEVLGQLKEEIELVVSSFE